MDVSTTVSQKKAQNLRAAFFFSETSIDRTQVGFDTSIINGDFGRDVVHLATIKSILTVRDHDGSH